MKIEAVATGNFRNLSSKKIATNARCVTLIGNNGAGKTNFLEAIYTACYGNSFRKSALQELALQGRGDFVTAISIRLENGQAMDISCRLKGGSRSILIDGKEIKDRKELIRTVPCIVFNHDDIDFVQGSPEETRKFYNQTMTLLNPLFLDDLRNYQKILKQRNAAVKEQSFSLLDIYNMKIAEVGLEIQKRRSALVEEFNNLFPQLFRLISEDEEEVSVSYRPSWKGCKTSREVQNLLEQAASQDIRYQTTTTGPHRDRFLIVKKGRNYVTTASTGQKRLISLVLRAAQAAFFTKQTGVEPILLIDDVLLELDFDRRARFLKNIANFSQAFFTFLPGESYFGEGSFAGLIYYVCDGNIDLHEESIRSS